jgi:parallel beta-helix repeat protein
MQLQCLIRATVRALARFCADLPVAPHEESPTVLEDGFLREGGMKTIVVFLHGLTAAWLVGALPAKGGENGKDVAGGRAVNCDDGGAIMRALQKIRPGETLFVSGTCTENVEVGDRFHDITLDGGGVGAISAPDPSIDALRIYGDQVTVRGLTISGGRDGINLRGAMGAVIENNILENNTAAGLNIHRISWATVKDNVIRMNGTFGIMVYENSNARIGFTENAQPTPNPNLIEGNGSFGIFVSRSSQADIAGNTIRQNVGNGIQVDRNSQAEIGSNAIDQNGGNAVNVAFGSGVNLGSGTTGRWQVQRNTSTVPNARFALGCTTGGYAAGSLGLLAGTLGAKIIANGCIDVTVP